MKAIEGMDLSLVEMRDDGNTGRLTPHCRLHGAMNKINENGVWRCIHTYRMEQTETRPKLIENNCRAGCVIECQGQ
jgi:hypothetical protein